MQRANETFSLALFHDCESDRRRMRFAAASPRYRDGVGSDCSVSPDFDGHRR